MRDTAKAAENELCKKFYGTDNKTQAKHLKTGTVQVPKIKSYLEVSDGVLVDEDDLAATIKATAEALAAARQLLEA